MAALTPGAPAPDFRLKNFDGTEIALSQYRGKKNVLLAFFPLAFTPVCSCQIPSYRDDSTPWIGSWPRSNTAARPRPPRSAPRPTG